MRWIRRGTKRKLISLILVLLGAWIVFLLISDPRASTTSTGKHQRVKHALNTAQHASGARVARAREKTRAISSIKKGVNSAGNPLQTRQPFLSKNDNHGLYGGAYELPGQPMARYDNRNGREYQRRKTKTPGYVVQGPGLELVAKVLGEMGYVREVPDSSNVHIVWGRTDPFRSRTGGTIPPQLKIHLIPAIGLIASKQQLIKIPSQAIPKAFVIPKEKAAFLLFASEHPEKMWVQKSSAHRGIQLRRPDDIDLQGLTIVQEFIEKPLLIDGRRFDIGVYTVISSVNPPRVYVLEDVSLFRFCTKRYDPLRLKDTDTYVVKENYKNTMQIPVLADIYKNGSKTYKEAFNTYFRKQGARVDLLWDTINSVIRNVVLAKHGEMMSFMSRNKYSSIARQLFEMVRFDFILDEGWNVYLMEVNTSPVLSTKATGLTSDMYQHVILNTLELVGVAPIAEGGRKNVSLEGDIEVFKSWCASMDCSKSCKSQKCLLCKHCLTDENRQSILDAYFEHVNRGGYRRVFPPPMSRADALNWSPASDVFQLTSYSERARMMFIWFIGMCCKDITWCS